MTSYDKKKYVCKMLYMYILGWEVDFGHVEAVNLIAGNKYTEKQIVRACAQAVPPVSFLGLRRCGLLRRRCPTRSRLRRR